MDVTELKQAAAEHAAQFVESGMVVGLGYGSTAIWAVRQIAERLQRGELRDIVGIPCALKTEIEARELGIPLGTLETNPVIDVTIDGADEVDPALDLIKGGGGALLREKIVAQASRREIIIVDPSKMVPRLGTKWALPIEVIPFGYGSQIRFLESLGAEVQIRQNGEGAPFQTDQHNLILDCRFGPIPDTHMLAEKIKYRTGIVEHGLFIGLATDVIIADANGIQHIQRRQGN
ncbi:MAG: ribose-5-phosphate isomerase RpiA [Anaerolineae bacterium]|nr:ribose-5-phosphate isomerase RpiA [Anaerolineae bacterium]